MKKNQNQHSKIEKWKSPYTAIWKSMILLTWKVGARWGASEFIFIFMVSDSQKLPKTSLPITFETLKGIALAYRSNINILKVEIEKARIQLLENLKFYQKHVCAQLLNFLKGFHDEAELKSAF